MRKKVLRFVIGMTLSLLVSIPVLAFRRDLELRCGWTIVAGVPLNGCCVVNTNTGQVTDCTWF